MPLAGATLGGLRIKIWGSSKPTQRYEFLGGLVAQKHCVLATTVETVARTIVSRVLMYEAADGTLTKLLTPDSIAVRRLGAQMSKLTQHAASIQPVEWGPFVASQNTASKVLRAQRALASLHSEALTMEDAELRTFGKREKLKFGKPLRIIQPRSDRYLFSLARYIKPMEKGLYRSIDAELGYVAVMKGMNGVQRAAAVLAGWRSIPDPVAVSVDIGKFDASTHESVLQQEHEQYTRCCLGDTSLAKMLRWQLTNRGRALCTDGVIKYGRRGGRMSGDPNTSLGNIIICSAAHTMYLEEQGIPFRIANDGDDSVIILSRKNLERYIHGLVPFWEKLGYHARIDGVAYEFSRIDFCQCRPVCVNGEWAFVRHPKNAIPKDLLNTTVSADAFERRAWYAAVGAGGMSQLGSVPMYQAFYGMLVRVGKANDVRYQWRQSQDKTLKFSSTGLSQGEVTPGTRVSFWEAFGVTPMEQLSFEHACDHFSPAAIPDQTGSPPGSVFTHLFDRLS